jgi:hypothetical protein
MIAQQGKGRCEISRSQEGDIVGEGRGQNKAYFNQAQNSYSNAQADVNNYENQLSDYKGQVAKFSAANPYTQGGEFQTATNQQLANTADAGARSAGTVLQGQALRTGQNTAGAIGATEEMERQGTRDLGAEEAAATQKRISGEAGYNAQALDANKGVLGATEVPAQLEAGLAGQQGGLANNIEGVAAGSAKTPSFADEFGDQFAKNLANLSTGGTRTGG